MGRRKRDRGRKKERRQSYGTEMMSREMRERKGEKERESQVPGTGGRI